MYFCFLSETHINLDRLNKVHSDSFTDTQVSPPNNNIPSVADSNLWVLASTGHYPSCVLGNTTTDKSASLKIYRLRTYIGQAEFTVTIESVPATVCPHMSI